MVNQVQESFLSVQSLLNRLIHVYLINIFHYDKYKNYKKIKEEKQMYTIQRLPNIDKKFQ
ncbi:unnamed protein product [Paramecium sonneborni]|uniref:Uncharacterized protein n=1 Tax=Paramecium sonneborni TaxID=65129 RepID=A0A8S1RI11_9CILI|nr:unnamed protein product [Paramecium sonneborni]